MVHETREVALAASEDRHLERIEGEVTARRVRHPPTHDVAVEHVNDEGHVDPVRVALHIGQVRHPESVERVSHEVGIGEIARPKQRVVGEGCLLVVTALAHARESELSHMWPDCGELSQVDLGNGVRPTRSRSTADPDPHGRVRAHLTYQEPRPHPTGQPVLQSSDPSRGFKEDNDSGFADLT